MNGGQVIQLYLAIGLSIAVAVGAVLQVSTRLPLRTDRRSIFAGVTLTGILLIALLAPAPVNLIYKGAILLGLVIVTIGLVLIAIPGTPVYAGLGHFLVAFFLFFVAFSTEVDPQVPTPWGLFVVAYCGLLYWLLAPALRQQRGAVILYMVLLGFATWRGLDMWIENGGLWSGLALLGIGALALASSLAAYDRWRAPVAWQRTVTILALYAGQWLLAWSVWGLGQPIR